MTEQERCREQARAVLGALAVAGVTVSGPTDAAVEVIAGALSDEAKTLRAEIRALAAGVITWEISMRLGRDLGEEGLEITDLAFSMARAIVDEEVEP